MGEDWDQLGMGQAEVERLEWQSRVKICAKWDELVKLADALPAKYGNS